MACYCSNVSTRYHVAAIDGNGIATSWDPGAGNAAGGYVHSLLGWSGTIYAGGDFMNIAGVNQTYFAGILNGTVTGVDADATAPASPRVIRAAPNPFASATTVQFSLPVRESVSLAIFDLRGRLVRRLQDGLMNAGAHAIPWDGRDDAGRSVGSGVYSVSVRTPTLSLRSKIFRLR